jgi:hypothetical protein
VTSTAPRWEYKTLYYDSVAFFTGKLELDGLEKVLNEFGREGWELATTTMQLTRIGGKGRGLVLVLKKQR